MKIFVHPAFGWFSSDTFLEKEHYLDRRASICSWLLIRATKRLVSGRLRHVCSVWLLFLAACPSRPGHLAVDEWREEPRPTGPLSCPSCRCVLWLGLSRSWQFQPLSSSPWGPRTIVAVVGRERGSLTRVGRGRRVLEEQNGVSSGFHELCFVPGRSTRKKRQMRTKLSG